MEEQHKQTITILIGVAIITGIAGYMESDLNIISDGTGSLWINSKNGITINTLIETIAEQCTEEGNITITATTANLTLERTEKGCIIRKGVEKAETRLEIGGTSNATGNINNSIPNA